MQIYSRFNGTFPDDKTYDLSVKKMADKMHG